MFIKLLHGLHSVLSGILQKWTKQDIQNIQDSLITTHDFDDGLGTVKAVPLDDLGHSTELDKMGVFHIPNDVAKHETKLNNMTVFTPPNDILFPNTEISSLTVFRTPNDIITPRSEINKMSVINVENDKLGHSLSLVDFMVTIRWTDLNIPDGDQLLHDFGNGEIPASPVDYAGVKNTAIKAVAYPLNAENCGVRNDEIKPVSYPVNIETCGVRNDVVNIISYPINIETCGVRNDVINVEIVV